MNYNLYHGLGFFKSKSELYSNGKGKYTLYFSLVVPTGRKQRNGNNIWRYVSFVAYNKIAEALNNSVKKNDYLVVDAEPITVCKEVKGADNIYTQYLKIKSFQNLSQLIERKQQVSFHDLDEAHVDEVRDEVDNSETQSNSNGINFISADVEEDNLDMISELEHGANIE